MKIIENLLKVKSLMTLGILTVFIILSLNDKLDPAVISFVISAVITYYFSKKEGD